MNCRKKTIKMKTTKMEEDITKNSIEYEEYKHQNYSKNQIKMNPKSYQDQYKVVQKPKMIVVFGRNDVNA